MSILGKDQKGRIWFKSDWFLSDITDAIDFFVVDDSFLWYRWVKLCAKVPFNKDFHGAQYRGNGHGGTEEYTPKYYDQIIGWYRSVPQASLALENLMPLLGIQEISPIDGQPYMRGKK